jgi:uncharacterized membrane protein
MTILPPSRARKTGLILVSILFSFMGISHFTRAEMFSRMVPPYLPAPLLLVYVSGICEILGGIGILVPQVRRAAGFGLIALLVAVYPANVHMALYPEQFPGISATALYLRLPFQFVFAALVWWAAVAPGAQTSSPGAAREHLIESSA